MTTKTNNNDFLKSFVTGLVPDAGETVELPPVPKPEKDFSQYKALLNPNWPEARWDVSGAFAYDPMLRKLHDFFIAKFGIKLFSCVHGAPLCLWNGGRSSPRFIVSKEELPSRFELFSKRNIAVELTCTNPALTQEHLEDLYCNTLLQTAESINQSERNGVIVCEELLADHVRRYHPKLRLIASVIKISKENGKGKLDYYRSLEDRYDKIMVHPDDNLNDDLMEKIENKEKYTLLVNEQCLFNCPVRSAHYRGIAACAFNPLESRNDEYLKDLVTKNDCNNLDRLLYTQGCRTTILSTNEIKRLYDMGFRDFKIQGRGLNVDVGLFLEIFRLMLNHQDPSCDNVTARVMQAMFGA